MPVIATPELIDAMVDVEIANLRSRLSSYGGVFIEQFGSATALCAPDIPVRLFNSVLGFAPDTPDRLDAIADFYRDHGVSEAIEVVPGRLSEEHGLELGRRGFALVEFHGAFALELSSAELDRPPRPEVLVERIDAADGRAFDLFLRTHNEGWGADPGDPRALANMRGWRDNDTWQFFLATIGGEPAAAAILDIRGDHGLLASGSTRPAARGRGAQAALIDARVRAAAEAGCTWATAGSYWGNSSMRNLARAGFSTIFVRGIWIRC